MANRDCSGVLPCFVKNLSISYSGLALKSKWLASYDFVAGGEASLLVLPGYLVATTQPQLCQQLAGVQELQYRQDELNTDFSFAIERLVGDFAHASARVPIEALSENRYENRSENK